MSLKYGTSGFRYNHNIIIEKVAPKILYALVIIAIKYNFEGFGIMVTASHNPACDNGVKIIANNGSMICLDYELMLEDMINEISSEQLRTTCEDMLSRCDNNYVVNIIIGRDTRPSGLSIINIISQCVIDKIKIIDVGTVTTPELHYITREILYNNNKMFMPYEKYTDAILKTCSHDFINSSWLIDCANGVGAILLDKIITTSIVNFTLINTNVANSVDLNNKCGAHYIHSSDIVCRDYLGHFVASLDGDADRLVLVNKEGRVIGGDETSCFLAHYISNMDLDLHKLKLGYAHTMYTNTSALNYVNKLGFVTICTDTGIKNLCAQAHLFDVAVIFEPNGHGSVFFSDKAKTMFLNGGEKSRMFYNLCDQNIGNGVGLLLLLMYVANDLKLNDLGDIHNLYCNKPSSTYSLPIYDINCNINIALAVINEMSIEHKCKIFVRKSGTEPIVRIYIECDEESELLQVCKKVTTELLKYL